MTRLVALVLLAGAGILSNPATASAQFGPRYPGYGGPVIAPSFNPFFYVPQYGYQSFATVNARTMGGNFSVGTRQYLYGVNNPVAALAVASPGYYLQGGTSGGFSARPNLALEAQRDLARAQRAMSVPGAYATPSNGPAPVPVIVPVENVERVPVMPDGFGKELPPADRARVRSGESLNELLVEIAKAEGKGGNRPSAFIPPMQLDEIRFGGSDAADALNLGRRAAFDFPAAFDDPTLKDVRIDLARDFAPVAAALQGGKSPEPAKRAQLEVTLQKVETALPVVVKTLQPADAETTRRFMTQLANTVKVLKAGAGTGLIDPKWATEGTTVADLAKHMTRHKLQFAAAPDGNEETYTTLHRNFATYLFLLTQPKK